MSDDRLEYTFGRPQGTAMQFDKPKLRAVVSYTYENYDPAKVGEANLNKVLYLTDMLNYLRVGSPITEATYRRSRFGPTCVELALLSRDFNYRKGASGSHEAALEQVSRQELCLLEDVIELVCFKNAEESVREFRYNKAWELAKVGDPLPYSDAALLLARPLTSKASQLHSSASAKGAAGPEKDDLEGVPFGRFRRRHIVTIRELGRLRRESKPIDKIDEDVRRLIDGMFETMYDAPGIGLAAIQIGLPWRIITMDLAKKDEPKNPQVFINPEVLWRSEEQATYEEGCLSIPEFYEEVERPARVKVAFTDRDGARREIEANGLLATCLQHEIDHLEGKLFIDYITKLKRDRVIKKFAKEAKRSDADK